MHHLVDVGDEDDLRVSWIIVKESYAGRQPHSLIPSYVDPVAGCS